jgi:hypothetical protein
MRPSDILVALDRSNIQLTLGSKLSQVPCESKTTYIATDEQI